MNQEVYQAIKALADEYAADLKQQVDLRIEEMKSDDNSHYLLYRVLGVSDEEGNLIDFIRIKGDSFISMQEHSLKRQHYIA